LRKKIVEVKTNAIIFSFKKKFNHGLENKLHIFSQTEKNENHNTETITENNHKKMTFQHTFGV